MKLINIFCLFIFTIAIQTAFACTGFFLQNSPHPIMAKNLDWMFDQGIIYINKRNVEKNAALIGAENGVKWISKYMSFTVTQDGLDFPWEGMNEKGLVVNVFQLEHSIVPPESNPLPAIEVTQWIQYILDTSSNTEEAITNAKSVRVTQTMRQPKGNQSETTAHYFVCDAYRKCAIFEYINGELVIHHSNKNLPYLALANDQYDTAVEYFKSNSRFQPVLFPNTSLNRFLRAVNWSENFQFSSENEIEYAFTGLQDVSQEVTRWKMVFDLNEKIIYLSTQKSPMIKSIDLKKFDSSCLTPVKGIDVNTALFGQLTPKDFKDYSTQENQNVLNKNPMLTIDLKKIMGQYPSTMTRCVE